MTTAATVPQAGFGFKKLDIRRRHLRLAPFADQPEVWHGGFGERRGFRMLRISLSLLCNRCHELGLRRRRQHQGG
jgi:hypothetical protein